MSLLSRTTDVVALPQVNPAFDPHPKPKFRSSAQATADLREALADEFRAAICRSVIDHDKVQLPGED